MTAFTPLGLEYQIGTDRPCDAPEVWCNFADKEDEILTAISDIRGRLFPAVPAVVFTTKSFAVTTTTVGFIANLTAETIDAVEADTDSMVDTNFSSTRAKMTRAGVYGEVGWQLVTNGGAATQIFDFFLAAGIFGRDPTDLSGATGAINQSDAESDNATIGTGKFTYQTASVVRSSANPPRYPDDAVGLGWTSENTPTENGVIGPGRFGMYWIRDPVT